VLIALLCLFLFVACSATAAEPLHVARLLAIDNDGWQSDLVASEAVGETKVELADYTFGPRPGLFLADNGAGIYPDFAAWLNGGPVRIARVEIMSGAAALHTQATYRDQAGDFNTVTIPALGSPLPFDDKDAYLAFSRIESSAERSTWLALLSDEPGLVTLSVYDGENATAGTEVVSLERGFTFYELRTSVEIGRLELKCGASFGCGGCGCEAPVDAVAFVGYRSGGGPRVEMPTLETAEVIQ
jgi:hypothetical protein